MSGRKPKEESRAAMFRQRLMVWKQTPELSRSSLRALARELGTSHQLLKHYLDGLEKWQAKEDWRRAKKIRDRARAENRYMTPSEEQLAHASDRNATRRYVASVLLRQIEALGRKAKKEPLNWWDIKTLKVFAKNKVPGAQELLQKYESHALSRAESERAAKKSCLRTVVVRDEHGLELQSAVLDVFDRKAVAKHEAEIVKRFGASLTTKHEGEKIVVLLQRDGNAQSRTG